MRVKARIPLLAMVAVGLLFFVSCQREEAPETAEQAAPGEAAPARQPAGPAAARRAAQPAAGPTEVQVDQGTSVTLTLNDALSSKTNQVGDAFSATVSQPVQVGEKVAIPEGSVAHGTVARVERAGRVKGRAQLALQFAKLELPDGQALDFAATLTQLGEEEKETVTQEGEVKGEASKKRDIGTIAGGAGIGAAVGAITGGKKGAAIGAGTGAAAGTAVTLLTRGKDVELKEGSHITVQLAQPLTVRVP